MQGPELRTVYSRLRPNPAGADLIQVKGRNPFKECARRKAFYQAIDMKRDRVAVLGAPVRPIGM